MLFYQIREALVQTSREDCLAGGAPYVAVLTPAEWREEPAAFNMGIELELELDAPHCTKAEVNYDSLTGSLYLPSPDEPGSRAEAFAFALDERGVVFIDSGSAAARIIESIRRSKKWKAPSLERFLYDFLEAVIEADLPLLEEYEARLGELESRIMQGDGADITAALNSLRGELKVLHRHYEQLVDLGQELEENENGFFAEEQLRYFHLFTARVTRLQDIVSSQREYSMQVRDLYQTCAADRQNRIMTVLTVVTSIFLPLTLIAGWYGMNFRYMPELSSPWGYPAVIAVSVAIAVICLLYFKKKKLF